MKEYLQISNGSIMYILASILILFVLVQSFVFLFIALKRGKEIGIRKEVITSTIRSSIILSIVPSLPIVISLIAIAPILGIPFSWLRLSIIGSAPYELISAEIGAKSMGIASLGADGYTAEVFANSMWIMSIGIIWGLVLCIFFLKKYQGRLRDVKKKDSSWVTILIHALFFGMLSVFIGPPLVQGGSSLYVLLFSAFVMLALTYFANKFKLSWVHNFSLAVSMLSGMTLAVYLV